MSTNDSTELFTALHRLSRHLHRLSHRLSHTREGQYREQSRLLLLIEKNDGVIQRDLAAAMDVRPSSMTEMLLRMEQLGLVVRRQDENDQRVMHIFLTDQGKEAAGKSRKLNAQMTDALFGGLAKEEISELLRLTKKLCLYLDAQDSEELEHGGPHGHHRRFGEHHHGGGDGHP